MLVLLFAIFHFSGMSFKEFKAGTLRSIDTLVKGVSINSEGFIKLSNFLSLIIYDG